jgi:hypothetical protein
MRVPSDGDRSSDVRVRWAGWVIAVAILLPILAGSLWVTVWILAHLPQL